MVVCTPKLDFVVSNSVTHKIVQDAHHYGLSACRYFAGPCELSLLLERLPGSKRLEPAGQRHSGFEHSIRVCTDLKQYEGLEYEQRFPLVTNDRFDTDQGPSPRKPA